LIILAENIISTIEEQLSTSSEITCKIPLFFDLFGIFSPNPTSEDNVTISERLI
jgi:hypothetical protein